MTSLHPISAKGYDILRGVMGSTEAPSRKIGKYRTIRELGRGGMAVVYEAEDPELRRRVALKILREDATDARVIQRLHREAAIGAQLRHPNIVRVFEVGVAGDASGAPVHFIAMEYVEGRTLADLMAEKRTPRAKLLEIVDAVADAVGYAHEQGVVHRDLKPANVLVDAEGRAALADFGLARAASFATPLTRANAVMGTPQYMAPEQVEGKADEVDARTDVYALGVMLYEILSGRAPFESETLASLYEKILRSDPVHPSTHDRTIDRDLEWICLTAMARERERRYPDGRAFHRDLRRHREGQPVEARPPSLFYRFRKRFRRQRGAAVILAGAIVAVAAIAIPLHVQAARAREAALSQLRSRTGENLAAALALRREGNLEGMRVFAANVEKACAEAIPQLPGLAEPHQCLGRMRRAMMDNAGALECQEQALKLDPAFAPALYERIVLNARRHRDALRAAVDRRLREEGLRLFEGGAPGPMPAPGKAVEDPAASAIRAGMERDLVALLGSPLPPGLGSGAAPCARGLLAWIRGDEATARRVLAEALDVDPLREEATDAISDLEVELSHHDAVVKIRTEGIFRDRGYVPHWESRAEARVDGAIEESLKGKDPRDRLGLALEDFDQVLALDPGRVRSLRGRAIARIGLAEMVGYKSPAAATAQLDGAIADLGEAMRREPGYVESYINRSHARYRRAQIERDRPGGDPVPHVVGAIADADKAVELDPEGSEGRLKRAIAKSFRGRWCPGETPPAAWFKAAAEDLRVALERNPLRIDSWKALAIVHRDHAVRRFEAREDPGPEFQAGIDVSSRALERAPGRYDLWLLRGELHYLRGAVLQAAKTDPLDAFKAGESDFTRSIELNPASGEGWTQRAQLRRQRGLWNEDHGGNALESYDQAIDDGGKAAERSPSRAVLWSERGYTRLLAAAYALQRGNASGSRRVEEALGDLDRAIGIDANLAAAWKYRGRTRSLRGDLYRATGREAGPEYRAAMEDLERAGTLDDALKEETRTTIERIRALLKPGRDY